MKLAATQNINKAKTGKKIEFLSFEIDKTV